MTGTGWGSTISRWGPSHGRWWTSATTGSCSVGASVESPPQEYTYIPGYYAVFFYDPDGLKLEIVHVPPRAA